MGPWRRSIAHGMISGPSSNPSRSLESPVKQPVDYHHHGDRKGVAAGPVELRHVLEVHSVDAGDQRGNGDESTPRGQALRHFTFGKADECDVHGDSGLEHFANAVDRALDAREMIEHV